MSLRDLMVDTKDAWVDYPGLDGFSVHVVNLGRERLVKLRKSCIETKFDRKTKMPYEDLNEKKFVSEFTKAVVKNWKGLKYKYLEDLMLADVSQKDPEDTLEFTQDNADVLVSNSGDFDAWLNSVVFDLENFRSARDGRAVAEAGPVSE